MNPATERGRIWWKKVGLGIVSPKFGEMLDEMLANHPNNETWDELGNWNKGLSDT